MNNETESNAPSVADSEGAFKYELVMLYLTEIPGNMLAAGFYVEQILQFYRCLAEGEGREALSNDPDQGSSDIKARGNAVEISTDKEVNHCIPGLEVYSKWRKANEKTDTPGANGFTEQQMRCLDDIEKWIKELDMNLTDVQEHRRPGKVVCDLMIKAISYLRAHKDRCSAEALEDVVTSYLSVENEVSPSDAWSISENLNSTLINLGCQWNSAVEQIREAIDDAPLAMDDNGLPPFSPPHIDEERSQAFSDC